MGGEKVTDPLIDSIIIHLTTHVLEHLFACLTGSGIDYKISAKLTLKESCVRRITFRFDFIQLICQSRQ
jgi:hypothetical protein